VDAPTLEAEDLAPLFDQPPPGAAFEGLHLPMVVCLDALPKDAEPDWPLGRFVERAGLARVPCPVEATDRIRGANTPQERAALLNRLENERAG
jgi:molybdopterin-guanine dinucleotide biosynthesis protein A